MIWRVKDPLAAPPAGSLGTSCSASSSCDISRSLHLTVTQHTLNFDFIYFTLRTLSFCVRQFRLMRDELIRLWGDYFLRPTVPQDESLIVAERQMMTELSSFHLDKVCLTWPWIRTCEPTNLARARCNCAIQPLVNTHKVKLWYLIVSNVNFLRRIQTYKLNSEIRWKYP